MHPLASEVSLGSQPQWPRAAHCQLARSIRILPRGEERSAVLSGDRPAKSVNITELKKSSAPGLTLGLVPLDQTISCSTLASVLFLASFQPLRALRETLQQHFPSAGMASSQGCWPRPTLTSLLTNRRTLPGIPVRD